MALPLGTLLVDNLWTKISYLAQHQTVKAIHIGLHKPTTPLVASTIDTYTLAPL